MNTDKKLTRRQWFEYWWTLPVGGALSAGAYMAFYAARITFFKHRAGAPQFIPGKEVKVAQLSDFGETYASKTFEYTVGPQTVPGIVLRLPEKTEASISVAGAHIAAFSRICTHLGCPVQPLNDPEAAAVTYNYRPSRPVLGCPCHFSMFDPLLDGESIYGKALYPLPRFQLKAKGTDIYAIGIEPNPNVTRM